MILRQIKTTVQESLNKFPVVGLIGARQVGKTTLGKAIATQCPQQVVYLDLELPSDLAKLDEPELYLQQHSEHLVILDEIQRKPELFPVLRALVDVGNKNGRFLVLGSASGELIRQSSESLAGRIIYHELKPFSLGEIGITKENVTKLWCRGGFPRSLLADTAKDSFQWRNAFIQTHLERDIPRLGIRIPATALRRFWMMLAHCHGQLWNGSKIAGSLGVSAPTVRRYLDILQDTFMLRQLQPFHSNIKKRLVKTPKVYLRDSGLLHALLGLEDHEALLGHPSAGASWEGWVIEQVLTIVPDTWATWFYRTGAKAEIDLVIQPGGRKPLIAIEIKHSLTPKPTQGFWSAFSDLEPAQAFVVYPGDEYYPVREGVFALPICQLDRILNVGGA